MSASGATDGGRHSRTRTSAGLLLYRRRAEAAGPGDLQVLIVHPGGPFWAGRDAGAWSIPKGEYGPDEDPLAAAAREFGEELGVAPPPPPWTDLGEVVQAGGKRVRAWAAPGDLDPGAVHSNRFTVEWPPRSGRVQSFPEVDTVEWVDVAEARRKLVPAQVELVDRLMAALTGPPPTPTDG